MNASTANRGFTLVEVLLYIAIAAAVAITAFQALQLFDDAAARSSAMTAVDAEASFLADRIHEILRTGTAAIPDGQETTSILELDDGTQVGLTDTTVMFTRGAATEPLTSARVAVTDLRFTDMSASGSPDLILLRFTMTASLSDTVSSASYSHDYSSTIGIR